MLLCLFGQGHLFSLHFSAAHPPACLSFADSSWVQAGFGMQELKKRQFLILFSLQLSHHPHSSAHDPSALESIWLCFINCFHVTFPREALCFPNPICRPPSVEDVLDLTLTYFMWTSVNVCCSEFILHKVLDRN